MPIEYITCNFKLIIKNQVLRLVGLRIRVSRLKIWPGHSTDFISIDFYNHSNFSLFFLESSFSIQIRRVGFFYQYALQLPPQYRVIQNWRNFSAVIVRKYNFFPLACAYFLNLYYLYRVARFCVKVWYHGKYEF